jgi:cytidine deaminase
MSKSKTAASPATEESNTGRETLLRAAAKAAEGAYAPYSRFAVGAAVRTADGRIFTSANMENASYGLTCCAELGALQVASSLGALGEIIEVAVVGGPILPKQSGEIGQPTPPCGRCRQLIAEAAHLGGHDIVIWFADRDLTDPQSRTISDLLPDAFGGSNLPR